MKRLALSLVTAAILAFPSRGFSQVLATYNATGLTRGSNPTSLAATQVAANVTATSMEGGNQKYSNNFFPNSFGIYHPKSIATLAEAVSENNYFTFKVTPGSGQALNISGVDLSGYFGHQNYNKAAATFYLEASIGKGFDSGPDHILAKWTPGEPSPGPGIINLSGNSDFQNVTTPIEFRIYVQDPTAWCQDVVGGGKDGANNNNAITIDGTVGAPGEGGVVSDNSITANTTTNVPQGSTPPPLAATSVVAPSGESPPTPPVPVPQPGTGISTIGINLTGDWFFADAIRQARPNWDGPVQADWGGGKATEDSDNWPTQDASLLVWEGHGFNDGTYQLSFNGKATIAVSFNYGTVNGAASSTGTYNSSTNTTTATVVITHTGFENCSLVFTGTQRTSGSAPNTGITHVHLWRPVSEGAPTSYKPGTLFTNQTLAMSQLFSTNRFMVMLDVNNSTITNWSGRNLPGAWNQNDEWGDGAHAKGIAYEFAVAYSNASNTDLYLNVPDSANLDPSYYTNLANLVKYGSDGVNPYTSVQTNPVYAPLNSNLHIYLEYSNEVWNSGFKQFTNNKTAVQNDQTANNAEWAILNYDGAATSNFYTGVWRRIAYQGLLLSNAFRKVYTDAAMPPHADPTVRPLLMFQADNGQSTGSTDLQFLDDYFNNSDGVTHVTTPHPVNYYFWGGGAATYFGSNNDLASSVDDLFKSGIPSKTYAGEVQTDTALVKGYGLKRVAYEGGWSPQNPPNGYANTHGSAPQLAKDDPRAKTAEESAETTNQQSGVDLNMFFTSSDWNVDAVWSMTSLISNLNTPLFQAIKTLGTTGPAPLNYGNPISKTKGAATTLTVTGDATGSLFKANNFGWLIPEYGWVPLISAAGSYQISLDVDCSTPGQKVVVLVDGKQVGGVISVPPNGLATIPVATVSLSTGQHGLIVQGQWQSTNSYNTKGGYNFNFVTGVTLAPQ